MLKLYAQHHNKIQFFGYEVANIVWVLHHAWREGTTGYGLNVETCAAAAFLLGSALIWRFEPQRRPQMLLWGGLVLALGGLFLFVAGFPLTGLAVTIASLETARGGLRTLQLFVAAAARCKVTIPPIHERTVQTATRALGWYLRPVEFMVNRITRMGRLLDQRPFVTGALIKAPLRLEFIGKKILVGDWIGAAVGLSWMLLGDIALAFNDEGLNAWAEGRTKPSAVSFAGVDSRVQ